MCPGSTPNDVDHGALADPKALGDRPVATPPSRVESAYLPNVGLGEHALAVQLAAMCSVSPLRHLVGVVVGSIAKKQVVGVAARRVVAPVANTKPSRDRAMRQLPRDTVRTGASALDGDPAVAGNTQASLPLKTASDLVAKKVRREALRDGWSRRPRVAGELPKVCSSAIPAVRGAPVAVVFVGPEAIQRESKPALGAHLGLGYRRSIHGLILRGSAPRSSQSDARGTTSLAQQSGVA